MAENWEDRGCSPAQSNCSWSPVFPRKLVFITEPLGYLHLEGTYLNIIKTIYNKPIANIILNSEKLKASSSIIHNSQMVEATQMSNDRYTHNGILFSPDLKTKKILRCAIIWMKPVDVALSHINVTGLPWWSSG